MRIAPFFFVGTVLRTSENLHSVAVIFCPLSLPHLLLFHITPPSPLPLSPSLIFSSSISLPPILSHSVPLSTPPLPHYSPLSSPILSLLSSPLPHHSPLSSPILSRSYLLLFHIIPSSPLPLSLSLSHPSSYTYSPSLSPSTNHKSSTAHYFCYLPHPIMMEDLCLSAILSCLSLSVCLSVCLSVSVQPVVGGEPTGSASWVDSAHLHCVLTTPSL